MEEQADVRDGSHAQSGSGDKTGAAESGRATHQPEPVGGGAEDSDPPPHPQHAWVASSPSRAYSEKGPEPLGHETPGSPEDVHQPGSTYAGQPLPAVSSQPATSVQQGARLQPRTSQRGGHASPPCAAAVTTSRVAFCVPTPHIPRAQQPPWTIQPPTWQSTGQGCRTQGRRSVIGGCPSGRSTGRVAINVPSPHVTEHGPSVQGPTKPHLPVAESTLHPSSTKPFLTAHWDGSPPGSMTAQ